MIVKVSSKPSNKLAAASESSLNNSFCSEAAASLLEGLEETFTINRLGLPASVRWAAAAYRDAEKSFRRIMGYRDL